MLKGVKFRLYPNKAQAALIDRTLGCCRLVYNKGLAKRSEDYQNGIKSGYKETAAMVTSLKTQPGFAFLKEVDSIALQQSLRDLDTAYKNFFAKRASYPNFKSKHNHHQSYRTINQKGNIRFAGKYIKLPKLGYVKVRQSMAVGCIHNATIEKTPTGKYFVTLQVEFTPAPCTNAGGIIGIDMGISAFYTDSNGHTVENPKYLEKSLKTLAREQRRLSRKTRSSNNYHKQRLKVARLHERVTNQRNDFLQKLSTQLICENQTICIEDLKIRNMVRNHKLAGHISSAAWGTFFHMLEYKVAWNGNDIVRVPTMYPSSQLCSCCGYKNPAVKDLKVRKWNCPQCHTAHDRDTNAAINIRNHGLRLLMTA